MIILRKDKGRRSRGGPYFSQTAFKEREYEDRSVRKWNWHPAMAARVWYNSFANMKIGIAFKKKCFWGQKLKGKLEEKGKGKDL